MAQPRSPAAGGIFLTLGAIGGAALGFALHQPTLYFLAGLALGTLLALLVWWRGR